MLRVPCRCLARLGRHIGKFVAEIGLRVGVKKVGCSGFAYTFDYADAIGAGDLVIVVGAAGTLLTQLGAAGFRTVALTPSSAALDVDRAAADGLLDAPVALVVGAEGPGLAPATLRAADHMVRGDAADAYRGSVGTAITPMPASTMPSPVQNECCTS